MPGQVNEGIEDLTETEDLCAFCLDRIQDPEKLLCNHAFCKSCLEVYLEARNWVAELCPICRRSLSELLPKQGNEGWRLFGFMTLLIILLSLGPFYLLLIYW
ncbi:E3 ubiquitin-protein ligase RNF125 isoform X2 [Drosophila serrata]|uniref:E3 ubiquitin-protein ligase RNF125 isoform X2 n=1 Tax=Drosophila serrata TaxID=7274 RepID=UPI000A1D0F2B|nr:E3 ubiquitin-protein ligase RNF125 isoform X2 [Drosophila serrata]